MTLTSRLTSALVLVAALAAPAMAQPPREDAQVARDIASAVITYPQFTIFDDISATLDRGTVVLSGKVTMPYKRDDLARRIAKVAGVDRVENNVQVLPVSFFDDDLRHTIARAIYRNDAFTQYASMMNPPIHVIVEHGRVTLTGVVNSDVERVLARVIAASFGEFSLVNDLKTDAEMAKAAGRGGL